MKCVRSNGIKLVSQIYIQVAENFEIIQLSF